MNDKYIGTQVGTTNFLKKIIKLQKYHCNVIQVMVSSFSKETLNSFEKYKNFSSETYNYTELRNIYNYINKYNIKIIIHSSYENNIARFHDPYSIFIRNIIYEIKFSSKIGASYIIIHLGKQLKLSLDDAYHNMYQNLLYIHNQTIQLSNILLVLEMVSGQGSELCSTLEELGKFFKIIKESNNKLFINRIKICIDTCHIFAAGYDINSKKKINLFLQNFNKLIGLKYVGLIHLNNSLNKLGSHKDRHACLNNGYITLDSLLYFSKLFIKNNIPIILETPNKCYKQELQLLYEL